MGQLTKENLHSICQYHSVNAEGLQHIQTVRDATEAFIQTILMNCPDCADRTVSIRSAREALLWANASIALDGEI